MADDLAAMGLSHKEVRYYAQEYAVGHAIVAIRPTGREWCRSAKPHDFLLVLADRPARSFRLPGKVLQILQRVMSLVLSR